MSTHPYRATVAALLRKARESKGLTQSQLARRMGLRSNTVNMVEMAGRSDRPLQSVQTLLNYAEALGLELKIEFVEKSDGA